MKALEKAAAEKKKAPTLMNLIEKGFVMPPVTARMGELENAEDNKEQEEEEDELEGEDDTW